MAVLKIKLFHKLAYIHLGILFFVKDQKYIFIVLWSLKKSIFIFKKSFFNKDVFNFGGRTSDIYLGCLLSLFFAYLLENKKPPA
jgi:hypothetical protein